MNQAAPGSRRFGVWVRRQDAAEAPYALRFEVVGGKGVLRVARPGVLIDPPARPFGAEERLTGGQLRQSRFLYVRDGGREREAYSLNRLDDAALDRLPAGEWVELVAGGESHGRWLGVPAHLVEDVGDDPTNPQHAMLRDLSRDLRNLVERARPSIPPPDDDVLEADPQTSEEPIPLAGDDVVYVPDAPPEEDVGEVFTDQPGTAAPAAGRPIVMWSHAPVEYDAGVYDVEAFDESEAESTRTLPTAPAGDGVAAPPDTARRPHADGDGPILMPYDRSTTLVRHFRRRLAEESARVAELEAKVAALEARLASARATGR